MNKLKLILYIFLGAFSFCQAQEGNISLTYPDVYYLNTEVLIKNTETRIEICNVQIGAEYSIHIFDEREKDKRICAYSYGQQSEDETMPAFIKATKDCFYINLERYNCKFESSILTTIIIECLNCNPTILRDPDDGSCDLKMQENDDYVTMIDNLVLSDPCFEVVESSIEGVGVVGEFWQGEHSMKMDNGIILANAPLSSFQSVGGGNTSTSTGSSMGMPGDEDLGQILTYPTYDAASLEFDFIPNGNYMEFEYSFASEEYCEWVLSPYNDGFALLLSGPGIKGTDYGQPALNNDALNLAVLPGADGLPDYTTIVSIKTVHWDHYLYGHQGSIGNFYVSNNFLFTDPVTLTGGHNATGTCSKLEMMQSPLPSVPPAAPNENAFDAWTVPLKATFNNLIPGETYHLKFVMADGSDRIWGSAVFIKASSFIASGALGAVCDDGDPETLNDYIDENCDCVGSPIPPSDCEIFCPFTNSFINVCSECDNVIYADNCADAATPSICAIDGFETTTCGITPDGPGGLVGFCGGGTIVKNNSWIGFTPATSGRLHLNIEIKDCLELNPVCVGIQAAVARAMCSNPGNVFTGFEYETLDCVTCVTETFDLITVDAIAGIPHYIMINGCCGDVCEIIVNVLDGLPDPGWSLESVSGILCPDILNPDCFSQNSTASVFATPSVDADPNAELEFTWYDPNGIVMWQGPGFPAGNQQLSTLSGINPLSGDPYFCNAGNYSVTVRDLTTCCEDEIEVELIVGEPLGATAAYVDLEKDQFDCEIETLGLLGQPADAGVTVLFENWWKVDWSTYPPVRNFLPASLGASESELTITLEDSLTGAGTYVYSFIDQNAFCSSETFICVPADTIKPIINIEPPLELDCLANPVVTLDASASVVERVIMDCNVGDIVAGEFPVEEIVATTNYTVQWMNPDGYFISESDGLTPTVDKVGWYVCTITNLDNKCLSVDSVYVTGSIDPPVISLPEDDVLNCEKNEILIQSAISNGTNFVYNWTDSNGTTVSTSFDYLATTPDTYTLAVTNTDNNCQSLATIIITESNEDLEIDFLTPDFITCSTANVNVDATISGGITYTYSWQDNNGTELANTEDFTAGAAGTYTLFVTETNTGCTGVESIDIFENTDLPIIAPMSELTLTCLNTSFEQVANASEANGDPLDFEWFDFDMNALSSAASITITNPGMYTVVATNSLTGCSASETVNVTQDIDEPSVDLATAEDLTCINQSVALQGTGAGGLNFLYEWSDVNGVISNTNSATATNPGVYTLTVTNTDNGCSNFESLTIEENVSLPQGLTITGGSFSCSVSELEIMGASTSPNVSYEWTLPGNFTETGPIITITNPGFYSLVVTNEDNGCTDEITTEITSSTDLPTVSFEYLNGSGPQLNCTNPVAEINGIVGAGIQMTWTLPDGSIGTNPLSTSEAGIYLLTAFDPVSMCSNETMLNIIADFTEPIIQTTSGTIYCDPFELIIAAEDIGPNAFGTGFLWTFPDNTTSALANPTVTQTGTYSLIATGINGCTTETTLEVLGDTSEPGASGAPDFELTCDQTTYNLEGTTTTGDTFNWNGPAGFNSTLANPTIDQAGLYTLTVTNSSNKCESEYQVMISENFESPSAIVPAPTTLDCNSTSIVLLGDTDSGNTNPVFTWTFPDGATIMEQVINASSAGTYMLVVENEDNGCTSTQSVTITEDYTEPTATAEGGEITCASPAVTLNGESSTLGATFSWTGPNGFVSIDQNPSVTEQGTYVLIVTAPNGCTSMANAIVESDGDLPDVIVVIVNDELLDCNTNSVTLEASSSVQGVVFTWTLPDGSNQTNATIIATEPGSYTVEVIDPANGCVAQSIVNVEEDFEAPEISVNDGEIICLNPIIALDASSSTVGATYSWSGPNGFTSTEQNPMVDVPGTYILTVTDPNNACTATAMLMVDVNNEDIAIWYEDADGDGFGDIENSVESCEQPVGFVNNSSDCDDTNPDVNPAAAESCNGIDDDCDNLIDDEDEEVEGTSNWYADTDGDGFGNPESLIMACIQPDTFVEDNSDCDDTDPNVNPDAIEVCDGIDNNCNDQIDEDLIMTYYLDLDGDGYGDPDMPVQDCEQPANAVENNEDCDDSNGDVYPDATELCDELDNNCNGEVDEGLSSWLYSDEDGDGFGSDGISFAVDSVFSCESIEGYVDNKLDCDDSNPNANPDGEEIPDNGIDEDCDGEDTLTSIKNSDLSEIKVYPNPVSSSLVLEVKNIKNYEVSIFGVTGKMHLKVNNQTKIDVSKLHNGSYFLEILDLESRARMVKHIVVVKL